MFLNGGVMNAEAPSHRPSRRSSTLQPLNGGDIPENLPLPRRQRQDTMSRGRKMQG